MTDQPPAGPVAYVTGEYPKVSHTFIQREVEGLRALGIGVLPCTVRRPAPASVVGPGQAAEAARTFGILEAAKNPVRLIGAHLRMLRRSPGRWAAALGLAWRTRPPGVKALAWQVFYFLEAGVFADYLLARGARHIHNHFGDGSGTVTMITAEMAGLPFSITLHGPTIFFEMHWWRLDEKVARAAEYYRGKYGVAPTECYVHPGALDNGQPAVAAGVRLRANRTIIKNHFWLGLGKEAETGPTRKVKKS
jgi:hypothetical protein